MAMRAFRRNLNYAERTRMVNDPEFRRSELRRIQEEARQREVAEFVTAYETAYSALELTPAFIASRTGVFFPVPVNIYLQSAQATILQKYLNLYQIGPLGVLEPVDTPFQWNPLEYVYAYHPPNEEFFAEDYDDAFAPKRNKLV